MFTYFVSRSIWSHHRHVISITDNKERVEASNLQSNYSHIQQGPICETVVQSCLLCITKAHYVPHIASYNKLHLNYFPAHNNDINDDIRFSYTVTRLSPVL